MNIFPSVSKLLTKQTPYYYYDTRLLRDTLESITKEVIRQKHFKVHYAVKANANPHILKIICKAGLGADCVSGGEIKAALQAGFNPKDIVFAGVGKSDWEILLGLDNDIECFNVESLAELQVINELAVQHHKTARIALRINPEVGAHTHAHITTGLAENKFGISMHEMYHVIEAAQQMSNIQFVGLHFHIGSQIVLMNDFENLCVRINKILQDCCTNGITINSINVGGGLGIDYEYPDNNPIPNFKDYFNTYAKHLKLSENQVVHFELGRSVVAQCGSLITQVLYIKQGVNKQFCMVDAGMTDLIRPALYQAYHKIDNLSNNTNTEVYDVVGPICESSDVFVKDYHMASCKRGDLLAIRSAGAYGEIMASQYNCRQLPVGYFSEDF